MSSLYKNNGPAGMAAWDKWRTNINHRIEKPTRMKGHNPNGPVVLPVGRAAGEPALVTDWKEPDDVAEAAC
jgi:hypothetical protein